MRTHWAARSLALLLSLTLAAACGRGPTPQETPPGPTPAPTATPPAAGVPPDATAPPGQVHGQPLPPPPADAPRQRFDVVVVGGSSAGVGAALAAARLGAAVALVEESPTLGGMMSNGLSVTDLGTAAELSGFFEEFRLRVQRYYLTHLPDDPVVREDELAQRGLKYEPHVADRIIKEMVAEHPSITVLHGHVLDYPVVEDTRVTGVVVRDLATGAQRVLEAPVTVDAQPEGDVAALAGAPFRVGREPRSPQEPFAGVLYFNHRDPQASLQDPRSTGEGDHRVQAYSFLLTVKDYGPGADRTIPRPNGYDPRHYVCPGDWEKSWPAVAGRIPNGKMEINVHPYGSDLPGANYDYPTASYERRVEVRRRYLDHALGFLYHLQTMCGLRHLGLPEDEYPENGNVPYVMYVREARRIQGETLFTMRDAAPSPERPHRGPLHPTGIAVGAYPMDSHAVRPYDGWDTKGEGEFFLRDDTKPYQVPYGVLVPQRVDGVLVAVAVSATHVGYGTLRMEPVRWQMGEAAGVAAVLAGRAGVQPRHLDVDLLQRTLLDLRHQLYMHASPRPDHWAWKPVQWLAVRGALQADDPSYTVPVESSIDRAQGAMMLAAALGLLDAPASQATPVADVPDSHPAAAAVRHLLARGIVDLGPNGTFLPQRALTHQEAAAWLLRAHNLPTPGGATPIRALESHGLRFNPPEDSHLPNSPIRLGAWADLLFQAAARGQG